MGFWKRRKDARIKAVEELFADTGPSRAYGWRDRFRDRIVWPAWQRLRSHWSRHWQHWTNWGLAAITCAAAVATLWIQLGKGCDCDGSTEQNEQHRTAARSPEPDKSAAAGKVAVLPVKASHPMPSNSGQSAVGSGESVKPRVDGVKPDSKPVQPSQ